MSFSLYRGIQPLQVNANAYSPVWFGHNYNRRTSIRGLSTLEITLLDSTSKSSSLTFRNKGIVILRGVLTAKGTVSSFRRMWYSS